MVSGSPNLPMLFAISDYLVTGAALTSSLVFRTSVVHGNCLMMMCIIPDILALDQPPIWTFAQQSSECSLRQINKRCSPDLIFRVLEVPPDNRAMKQVRNEQPFSNGTSNQFFDLGVSRHRSRDLTLARVCLSTLRDHSHCFVQVLISMHHAPILASTKRETAEYRRYRDQVRMVRKSGPQLEIRRVAKFRPQRTCFFPQLPSPETAFLLDPAESTGSFKKHSGSNQVARKRPVPLNVVNDSVLNNGRPPNNPIDFRKLIEYRCDCPQRPRQIDVITVYPSKDLARRLRKTFIDSLVLA